MHSPAAQTPPGLVHKILPQPLFFKFSTATRPASRWWSQICLGYSGDGGSAGDGDRDGSINALHSSHHSQGCQRLVQNTLVATYRRDHSGMDPGSS